MNVERFTHKYVNYETIYGRNKLREHIQMTEMLHKSPNCIYTHFVRASNEEYRIVVVTAAAAVNTSRSRMCERS